MKKIAIYILTLLISFNVCSRDTSNSLDNIIQQIKLILKYPYNDKYVLTYHSGDSISKPYLKTGKQQGTMIIKNTDGDSLNYSIMLFTNKEKISKELYFFATRSNFSFPSLFCYFFYYKNYLFFLPLFSSFNEYNDARKYMTLMMCEAIERLAK